ncbi:Alpha beta hydrolase [Fragilaria crotonensis]|nr:Alpha beta hydrolase [Fragilaria crotonensis]
MDVETLEARLNDKRRMGKMMTLSDGRKLSYSEAGQVKDGYPVLFQVGLMCSSLAVVLFHDEALRLNLHIVTIDYPGIGESSPQNNRTLTDWPNDVLEFVHFLWGPNKSLALLSHSMGAPHALAIMSHPILSQRISRATLVSPWIVLSPTSTSSLPSTGWGWSNNQTWMPSVVTDSLLPSLATTWTSATLSMAGSIATCQSSTVSSSTSSGTSALNLLATQRIVGYSHLQGQEGNRHMVRLALRRIEPDDEQHVPYPFPLLILCGDNDPLVSPKWCRHYVRDLVKRTRSGDDDSASIEYRTIPGANHNSILGGANLTLVLESLC